MDTRYTITINNFNYGRFLVEAMDSAAAQSIANRLLVIDDGSVDNSAEILRAYDGHPDFQYHCFPNEGQLACFLRAIRACRTEYLCFLDADDTFAPNHLEVLDRYFCSDPELNMAWTQHRNTDGSEATLCGLPNGIIGSSAMLSSLTHHKPVVITSTIAIRVEDFKFLLELPSSFFQDWKIRADDCLLIAGTYLGKTRANCPEVTVLRRIHGANLYFQNEAAHSASGQNGYDLAKKTFAQWCAQALELRAPSRELLREEYACWPSKNRKLNRLYRKASRRLSPFNLFAWVSDCLLFR